MSYVLLLVFGLVILEWKPSLPPSFPPTAKRHQLAAAGDLVSHGESGDDHGGGDTEKRRHRIPSLESECRRNTDSRTALAHLSLLSSLFHRDARRAGSAHPGRQARRFYQLAQRKYRDGILSLGKLSVNRDKRPLACVIANAWLLNTRQQQQQLLRLAVSCGSVRVLLKHVSTLPVYSPALLAISLHRRALLAVEGMKRFVETLA